MTSHSPNRKNPDQNLPNINPMGQTQRGFTTTTFIPKRNKTTKMRRRQSTDQQLEAPDNPNLPKERETLMKRNRIMASGHYGIEIAKTNKAMLISAVRIENPAENYLIELEKSKGAIIFKEFGEDLKMVSQNLQILNRRLVLLNPQISKKPKKARRLFKKKASTKSPGRKAQTARSNADNGLVLADEKPRRLEATQELEEEKSNEKE